MAYKLPTLDEIVDEAVKRHRAELPGTDAVLWPNTEHVFVKAVAGVVYTAFEYLAWVKRQRFATEADDSELDAHGKPWKINRKPAVAAVGTVYVSGVVGYTVLAGTVFQRSDGVQFKVNSNAVITSTGPAAVSVTAIAAGTSGNTDALAELSLAVPDANITLVKVDSIGIGAGSDVEGAEEYRDRILHRQGNVPMGGSVPDYVRWVTDVPGVTRVWVEKRSFGAGTVGIWIMSDGSTANGIPSAILATQVDTYLDGLAPATARPMVRIPIPAAMDIKIAGITPTQTVQELIEAELKDIFRRRVSVSTVRSKFTVQPSVIWQAVARVTGGVGHRILLPVETQIPTGYIPVLNTICYSE